MFGEIAIKLNCDAPDVKKRRSQPVLAASMQQYRLHADDVQRTVFAAER
jgi:hypothetical protein